jgi:hypothetical protein
MLIDLYLVEDVFARVPEVATQTDPVLKTLDTCCKMTSCIKSCGPIWEPAIG